MRRLYGSEYGIAHGTLACAELGGIGSCLRGRPTVFVTVETVRRRRSKRRTV
jgi:hypothetical protein